MGSRLKWKEQVFPWRVEGRLKVRRVVRSWLEGDLKIWPVWLW